MNLQVGRQTTLQNHVRHLVYVYLFQQNEGSPHTTFLLLHRRSVHIPTRAGLGSLMGPKPLLNERSREQLML